MKKSNYLIIPFVFLLFTTTCNLVNQLPVGDEEKINTNIKNMAALAQTAETPAECFPDCNKCSEATGASLNTCINPLDNAIWPGSLVDAPDILTGAYEQIIVPRASLQVSVEYNDGSARDTIYPSDPETFAKLKSSLWLNKVKGNCKDVYHAYSEIKDIYSEEQLKIALDCHLSIDSSSLGTVFDFSVPRVRKMLKIMYIFYQVSLESNPETPSRFFDLSRTTWNELDEKIGTREQNKSIVKICPVYIPSVSYGTMGLFFFESANMASSNLLTDALMCLSTGCTVPAVLLNQYKDAVKNSAKKQLVCYNIAESPQLMDYATISSYILLLKNTERLDSCIPIMYSLKYLNDEPGDEPLRIVIEARDYSRNTCSYYRLRVCSANAVSGQSNADYSIDISNPPASIQISTIASYTSEKKLYTFTKWEASDPTRVTIANPLNLTTALRSFSGDCNVTAIYTTNATPTPTPTPAATATGEPAHHFMVYSYDSNGSQYVSYDVTESSVIPIMTEQYIPGGSDFMGSITLTFRFWELSNGADANLIDGLSIDATVTGFKADVTATARYWHAPPYNVRITHIVSNCTPQTDNVPVNEENGSVDLVTVSSCLVASPPTGDVYIYFDHWEIEEGNGTIESGKLMNINGNVSIKAVYDSTQ